MDEEEELAVSEGKFDWGKAAPSMIGGVGSIIGGIMDISKGGDMEEQGRRELMSANANIDKLRAAQPSLETPEEYYKILKLSYDQSLMNNQLNSINRSLSATIDASSQYGSRGVSSIMQATKDAGRLVSNEVASQKESQMSALAQLGAAKERERMARENRSNINIDYAYEDKKAAQVREYYGRQQADAGTAALVTGALKVGAGIVTGGISGGILEEGGIIKTDGDFSHSDNPLHLIDKDGNKVAELTGGEFVFNPTQAKEMEELSKKGKSKLHTMVRGLIGKFKKNG